MLKLDWIRITSYQRFRRKNRGLLQEKGRMNIKRSVTTAILMNTYLVYTGENHQQVIAFCIGSEAFKTKKNKIQINLAKESISAASGDYLVRNEISQIAIYLREEFNQLIEPEMIDVWKKM